MFLLLTNNMQMHLLWLGSTVNQLLFTIEFLEIFDNLVANIS